MEFTTRQNISGHGQNYNGGVFQIVQKELFHTHRRHNIIWSMVFDPGLDQTESWPSTVTIVLSILGKM